MLAEFSRLRVGIVRIQNQHLYRYPMSTPDLRQEHFSEISYSH